MVIRTMTRRALFITSLLAVIACSTNAPRTTASSDSSGRTGYDQSKLGEGPTELWVMGTARQPHLAKAIGSMGSRGFVNLRELGKRSEDLGPQLLKKYIELDQSLVITVRWVDPKNTHKDKPPTAKEGRQALDRLIKTLKSAPARQMDGRLWISFYSELASGGGSVPYEQSDGMFDWATMASERIRAEAPWVRMVGPGLTHVDILGKDEGRLQAGGREYYNYNDRIIRWSVEHADAVDIHLHVDSPEEAARRIKLLKDHLAGIPGGETIGLVSQEWSPAFYPDRNDAQGIRETIFGIYRVMNENNFLWAPYGAYYTFIGEPEHFHWKNLTENGKPHEPYHSIFTDLAAQISAGNAPGGDGGGDSGTDSEVEQVKGKSDRIIDRESRKQRRHRRRRRRHSRDR